MKTTKRGKISLHNHHIIESEIPITCPYCGAFVEPLPQELSVCSYNDSNNVYLITFFVNCCAKKLFAIYEKYNSSEKFDSKLLCVYPAISVEQLPEIITNVSPRFSDLFKQASSAESLGFIELAGSGYRNALEVLIKDYAIREMGHNEEEVSRKKLFDAIGAYVPSIAVTAADVIRVIGNDFTHYQRKYDDIDFQILKRYLHILIQTLENDYLLRHPIVNTNRS